MKKSFVYLVLGILLFTSVGIFPSISHGSTSAFVPITLTNSQTTATPVNFQQLIKVDWSNYSTYLNANISNVRFYNSTTFTSSYELPAWIETNNTTSATSSDVWVNLSGSIVPASGSLIIYMVFLSTTFSWDSTYWGLAPELSTTYGEFDNGANVFYIYSNFVSSAGWTFPTYGSGGGQSYTVSDGLTLQGGSSENQYATWTTEINPADYYVSTEASSTSSNSANGIFIASTEAGQGKGTMSFGDPGGTMTTFGGGSSIDVINQNGGSVTSNTQMLASSTSGTYYFISLNWEATDSSYGTVNNGNLEHGGGATPTLATSEYVGLGVGYSGNINAQYFIVRTVPPNYVMPATSFGTVFGVGGSYHISFSQIGLPSGYKWGIGLTNTTTTIWINSTSEYNNFTYLSAGTYTFQVINATGYASNPYTGSLTITSSNLTQSIVFTGYNVTVNETGMPSGIGWYANFTDQSGLSENTTGQSIYSNTTSLYLTLPNGTYTLTLKASNSNYKPSNTHSVTISGNNLTVNVTFTPVLYYLNFSAINKPSAVEWEVNVSGDVKQSYLSNISFQEVNNTYNVNISAINGTSFQSLGWWRLTNQSGNVILHNDTITGTSLHTLSSGGGSSGSSIPNGFNIAVNGNNCLDNITFKRAYNISIQETGIGNGFSWYTSWYDPISNTNQNRSIIISNSSMTIYFNSTEGNYTNGSYSENIQYIIFDQTNQTRYINYTLPTISSRTISGNDLLILPDYLTQYKLFTSSVPSTAGYHIPLTEWINASSQIQIIAKPNSSYQFTGFVGSNTSSYTGMGSYENGQYVHTITMTNSITEVMDYNLYIVLTFYMQNITSGTEWGIKLDQNSQLYQEDNGTGNYIIFDIPAGTYSYNVTGVSVYPQSNTISVSSSETILLNYLITTYTVTFNETGLPPGQNWEIQLTGSSNLIIHSSSTSQIFFQVPNGTYTYAVQTVYGYITNQSTGNFTISGSGIVLGINWTEGNAFILQGIRYFVPMYINTTNFIVPAGSQIPVSVNWSEYKTYLNVNLSNAMILNSTFYPLYAWIENNSTSSNTSSTVWVKIDQEVSYYSSQIDYLVFMQKQVSNFNPVGYWGEAPQLSPTFGEWNNIAEVMNKGLIYQLYINTSTFVDLGTMTGSLSANYSNGGNFTDTGFNFVAKSNDYSTPLTGSTLEVYQESSSVFYPVGTENNVIFDFSYSGGNPPGSFPYPITSTWPSTDFIIKAQGFIVQAVQSSSIYAFADNAIYVSVGNSGGYLNNGWASSVILDYSVNSHQQQVESSPISNAGTHRISMIYYEYTAGGASLQIWNSQNVSYYSPTPLNSLPTITFGNLGNSYSSFIEYGLPANTNWSIAIGKVGGNSAKIITSNTNIIYDYMSNGTYIYSVGSIENGSYISGFDDNYVPAPPDGNLIVGGTFTSQVIIWKKAQVLTYSLVPGQASYSSGDIVLPIFATDQNNLPANNTTITTIWKAMNLSYVSKADNSTTGIHFSFSSSGYGMFAIFFSLTANQVTNIKESNATLSMVSEFARNQVYTYLAVGIAGSASFLNVQVKGQNITSTPPSGVQNTTTNNTSVPWYVAMVAPYWPKTANNTLTYIGNIIYWIFTNSGGRALTAIVAIATLLYFAWMVRNSRRKYGRTKRQILTDKKVDALYRDRFGDS